MYRFLLMGIYICLSSFGLYYIKLANSFSEMKFIVGFLSYGFGFLMWMYILRIMPLSVAFPVASSGLIIATVVIGKVLLNEHVNLIQLIGVSIIIIGLCIVTIGKGNING